MDLFADRFLLSGREGIDLATLRRVRIAVGTCGGPGEQARWADACADALANSGTPPRLVDFGVVGAHRRFEAWDDSGYRRAGSDGSLSTIVNACAETIEAAA